MGNSVYTQFQYDVLNFPVQINLRELKNCKYCTLVENITTHELYEQYIVYTKQNKSIQQQLKIYQFRKKQNLNLVKIHFVKPIEQRNFCVGHHQMKIYTEHIQLILKDIFNITLETGIYIMQAALKGFKAIYKNFGYVNLNDAMIGINKEKKVKVWLNSNFALNNTQNTFYLAEETDQNKQILMVKEIFEIIEEHLCKSSLYIQFRNDRLSTNLYFEKSQVFLLNFAQKYHLIIPNVAQFDNFGYDLKNMEFQNKKIQVKNVQKVPLLNDFPNPYNSLKNQVTPQISRVKITVSNNIQQNLQTPFIRPNPFNQGIKNNQAQIFQIKNSQKVLTKSQISQNIPSEIIVKRPVSFKRANTNYQHINQSNNKISTSIMPYQSIQSSKGGQIIQNQQINSLSPNYLNQKHFGLNMRANIEIIRNNKPQLKQVNQKRKTEIEQAQKYFANLEKNIGTPSLPQKSKNNQKQQKPFYQEPIKMNNKQKIAKIIANVKQSQTIKQLIPETHLKKQSLNGDLEENQSYFFKNNLLDYQKYKKILQAGNTGQLKQSITFQELGNNIPIPHKIQEEVKLLKLEKLTGRREISKSLTPEDQLLYTYDSQKHPTFLPNEIKETSQFYENQY